MKWFILFSLLSITCARAELQGIASWYGPGFNGHKTSSGEIYNQNLLTAAIDDIPFGTRLLVVCPTTKKNVVVKVNDRGAYKKKYHRLLDLSAKAAKILGIKKMGVAQVKVYRY